MFEFIGFVLVIVIGWVILKGVFSGATKGHMLRSIDHANTLGVPYDFAKKMIQNREVMKTSVAHMAKLNSDFRAKDVYVQYGEAISMLYQGYLMEKEKEK
tara:strand:- start:251 stop:550 length:300 start_codon:yes stop_codon:yes gene_type:complete